MSCECSDNYTSGSEDFEGAGTEETTDESTELYDTENTESSEDLMENDTRTETESTETEDPDAAESCSESSTETADDSAAIQAEIAEKSEYSDEINENIKSVDELEVYQQAGLREEQIDGQVCLVRDDIDWEQTDEFGRTNRERVEDDLAPYAENGEKVELHHIGQKDDSPLAELTTSEHRGKGNDTVLHDKTKDSEIDRAEFNETRKAYWKARINH